MISRTGNNASAFTLVEVMVATAVLALLALLVHESFFISLDTYDYCRNYLDVFPVAGEKMWQAQDDMTRIGALTNIAPSGEFPLNERIFAWKIFTNTVDESEDSTLYRIDMKIEWQEGRRPVGLSRTAFAEYEKT